MDEKQKPNQPWKSRGVATSWTLKAEAGRGQTRPQPRKPWQAWLLAAPMPVIGILGGLYLANVSNARYVATMRAESPDDVICGLPMIPVLFAGLIGGAIVGIIGGGAVGAAVSWLMCKRQP